MKDVQRDEDLDIMSSSELVTTSDERQITSDSLTAASSKLLV